MEVWEDIEGYSYQVSSKGRVRSLDRWISYTTSRGKIATRFHRGVILKQSIGTSGYPTTHLHCSEKGRRTVMVHRLVALYHLPKEEGKEFVNHKDGDKTNNSVENLEWVTKSENTLHALDTGLLRKRGKDSNFAKLTEQQVVEILALRKYGSRKYFAKDLAPKYGISEEYFRQLAWLGNRWEELREGLTDEYLLEVFQELTKTIEPSKRVVKPHKHRFTEEEIQDIIQRRDRGDRVVDIAKDYNKDQKVISWLYLKHKREEGGGR